ncbi:MAG: hypothetical protein ACP5SI_11275 [Chloroflexia bacterium]
MHWVVCLLCALGGLGIVAICSLFPGLHVAHLATLLLPLASGAQPILPPEGLAFAFVGMASGHAMLHTLPGIFCAVPDEAGLLVVQPGRKYLLAGKGTEAALLCSLGGLGGTIVLLLLAPLAVRWLPPLYALLQPHFPWMLWAIIAYLLLSEWSKDSGRAPAGLPRLWATWKPLLAGLLTFLLAGLLGLVLSYRSPLPSWGKAGGLAPAFIGLFGLPWLLLGVSKHAPLPPQDTRCELEIDPGEWLRGVLAGAAGGFFAALFPALTAGVGVLLAGQGFGEREGRAFLVSQGACRVTYSLGSLLLFFVPGMWKVKGGFASPLSTVYTEASPRAGCLALGTAMLCSAFAFLFSLPLGRFLARISLRRLQQASLLLVLLILGATSGPAGLFVALVATAIGAIPLLWGTRRTNALGLVLLPVALNLSGIGERLAAWLGLL